MQRQNKNMWTHRDTISQTPTASHQLQNASCQIPYGVIPNTKYLNFIPRQHTFVSPHIEQILMHSYHPVSWTSTGSHQLNIWSEIPNTRQYVRQCGTAPRVSRLPSPAAPLSSPAWTPTRGSSTPPSVSTLIDVGALCHHVKAWFERTHAQVARFVSKDQKLKLWVYKCPLLIMLCITET